MTASLTQTTDRRKLLTSGLAAGLFAASGLSIIARPRVGGRMRAALSGASVFDTWDARKGFGLFMAAAGQGAVFDCLTEVAADGSLRGELATSWQASRDAKTWVFNLRKGVTFHNGLPFNSESVAESIQLHIDAGPSGAGWHLVSNIEQIRLVGTSQVQFTLLSGNADFPYLLSDRHLIMYPAGNIADAMKLGIGTGIYRAAKFEAGRKFLGWRVSDHYKDGSAGWFDQIEFLAVNDTSQRLALMQSGRVDAAAQIDPSDAPIIEAAPSMRLSSIPGNQHITIDTSTLDENARLAVRSTLDREDILLSGLHGYGHVGHDSPIGPFNQYYQAQATSEFDPDKALFLLNRAGLDGYGLNLGTLAGVPASLSHALWQSLSIGGFTKGRDGNVKAELWSGRATEDWMLGANSSLGGNSVDYNELRATARAEFDPQRRSELYARLQSQLRLSGPVVIPVFANFLHATSARIAEPLTQGNLWPMDNARFAERWWLS
jgi:peptide/nickel transport system substrate-binding protein